MQLKQFSRTRINSVLMVFDYLESKQLQLFAFAGQQYVAPSSSGPVVPKHVFIFLPHIKTVAASISVTNSYLNVLL